MDEASQKREQTMELTRREMERKSLDTIRIHNPLDRTFRYMFNGFWHQVPAKGTKDEPRYLAKHYFKKIAETMIGEQMILDGEELKKKREEQFGKSFIDKYEENIEVWNKVPRLDDPELLKQIKDLVIIGLVEEYGMEVAPENAPVSGSRVDFRSLQDQIFEDSDEKQVNRSVEQKYPINKANKKKLEEEATT